MKKFISKLCACTLVCALVASGITITPVRAEERSQTVQTVQEGNMDQTNKKVNSLTELVDADLKDYFEVGNAGEGNERKGVRVTKLQEGLFQIDEETDTNPANAFGGNNPSSMYLIVDEDSATLFDGGNGGANNIANMKVILEELVGEKDLQVILTHLHGDHVGLFYSTDAVPADTPMSIHEDDYAGLSSRVKGNYNVTTFKGGDVLECSGYSFKVVDLPGHTDGSCVFIDYDTEVCIAGDAMGSGSVWLWYGEDIVALDRGIDNVMAAIKDMENPIFYCGHRWQQFFGQPHANQGAIDHTDYPNSKGIVSGEIGKQYVKEMDMLLDAIAEGEHITSSFPMNLGEVPTIGYYITEGVDEDGKYPGIVGGITAYDALVKARSEAQPVEEGNMDQIANEVDSLQALFNAGLKDYYEIGDATKGFRVTKVQAGLYQIDEETSFAPANAFGGNNPSSMYLAIDSNTATLFDGGNGESAYNHFSNEHMKTILDEMVGRRSLQVILTHLHGDHVGLFNSTDVVPADTPMSIHEDDYAGLSARVKENYNVTTFKGGDVLDCSGYKFKVVDLPGHTDGSCVFIDYDTEVCIAGDAMGSGSVWLWYGEDIVALDRGIDNVMAAIKDMENPIFYCGHRWQQFFGQPHANQGAIDHTDPSSKGIISGEIGKKYVEEMDALLDAIAEGKHITSSFPLNLGEVPTIGYYITEGVDEDGKYPGIVGGITAYDALAKARSEAQPVEEGNMDQIANEVDSLQALFNAGLKDYYELYKTDEKGNVVKGFRVTKVQSGLYQIDEETTEVPANAFAGNNPSSMYLAIDSNSATLFDGGNGESAYNYFSNELMETILDEMVGRRSLQVILTHLHGDHVGLFLTTDIVPADTPMSIHEDDYAGLSATVKENYNVTTFKGGDVLDCSGYNFEVVDIKGHTDGSCVFIDYDTEVCISGDAMGSGCVWMFSDNNMIQFAEGIDNVVEAIADMNNPIFYAGHRWQQFYGQGHANNVAIMAGEDTKGIATGEIGKQYVAELDALMYDVLENVYETNEDFVPQVVGSGKDGIWSTRDKNNDGKYPGIVASKMAIVNYKNANGASDKTDVIKEVTVEENNKTFYAYTAPVINNPSPMMTPVFVVYSDNGCSNVVEAYDVLMRTGLKEIADAANAGVVIMQPENGLQRTGYDDNWQPIYTSWTADDEEAFWNVIYTLVADGAEKVGYQTYTNLLYVVGEGKGATFVHNNLSQNAHRIAGVITFGGEIAAPENKMPLPAYLVGANEDTIDFYKEINDTDKETTVAGNDCFYNSTLDVKKVVVDETETSEFDKEIIKKAWTNVLRKITRNCIEDVEFGYWMVGHSDEIWTLMERPAVDEIGLVLENVDYVPETSGYFAWVPEEALEADNTEKFPLVVTFHGSGDHPIFEAEGNGWVALAGEERFIVVAPAKNGADQKALIEEVCERYPVDTSRIYATGFSGGGVETIDMINTNPELFAAVAPMSSYPGITYEGDVQLPIFYESGLNDCLIAYPNPFGPGEYEHNEGENYIDPTIMSGVLNPAFKINGLDISIDVENLDFVKYPHVGFDREALADDVRTITTAHGITETISDYKNADGITVVRHVTVDGYNHNHYTGWAEQVWEFFKPFSRNTETYELVYEIETEDNTGNGGTVTGDNTNLTSYITVAGLSLAAVVVISYKKKKEELN